MNDTIIYRVSGKKLRDVQQRAKGNKFLQVKVSHRKCKKASNI